MNARAIKADQIPAPDRSNCITRRDFLKSTTLAASAVFLPVAGVPAALSEVSSSLSQKLTTGWEYFRGSLGGVWDVWRQDMSDSTVWKKVVVPHCFNAYDAVDPDQPFYEGPGWYRRKLQITSQRILNCKIGTQLD